MIVTLKTVEEYTGKSIPEIYDFDEDETFQYESFKDYIGALIEEMNDPQSPHYNPPAPGDAPQDYSYSYEPADFSISSSNAALLILLVIGFIAVGIKKKGG